MRRVRGATPQHRHGKRQRGKDVQPHGGIDSEGWSRLLVGDRKWALMAASHGWARGPGRKRSPAMARWKPSIMKMSSSLVIARRQFPEGRHQEPCSASSSTVSPDPGGRGCRSWKKRPRKSSKRLGKRHGRQIPPAPAQRMARPWGGAPAFHPRPLKARARIVAVSFEGQPVRACLGDYPR